MNKKDFQIFKNKIKELNNTHLYIEFKKSVEYHTKIYNAKLLVSRDNIFITNEKGIDLIIDLCYLDNVRYVNNAVILELWSELTIILDT